VDGALCVEFVPSSTHHDEKQKVMMARENFVRDFAAIKDQAKKNAAL
jgi:hypothetical protein